MQDLWLRLYNVYVLKKETLQTAPRQLMNRSISEEETGVTLFLDV